MFRPIRRKEKAISEEAAKELLKTQRRGVLAVNGEDSYPYAMPINYIYDQQNNQILFHGSRFGQRAECLKESDKVCFTVYGNETVKDEPWAPYLQSTIIFGKCHCLANREETLQKLRLLAGKYYPNASEIEKEIEIFGKAVQIYVIDIEHLTGKEIQEK